MNFHAGGMTRKQFTTVLALVAVISFFIGLQVYVRFFG